MRSPLSIWIARHLMSGDVSHRTSGPAVRVATAAVALGMVVMILSLAVGYGFQRDIRAKIVGFGTHVQIVSLDLNGSFETSPIENDSALVDDVKALNGVKNIQPFVTKAGIIKTDDAFQGIALKGVDGTYDWSFIKSILVEGDVVGTADSTKSDGILLSKSLANQLRLTVGDPVRMFFVKEGIRARRFTLCGTFDSHFDEFDKGLAYVDMRQISPLNNWSEGQISGYEILLEDFDQMDIVANQVSAICSAHATEDNMLRVRHIRDMQPQIFGWLNLLDKNIVVIIALIIAVAGLNMATSLLIIILEHTNNIGLMKAMGASDSLLRHTFVAMALKIVGKGLLIGDAVGVALCVTQSITGLVKLDAENYYLDTVPIDLSVTSFLALNIGVMLISAFILMAPSAMVSRISPTKAIRFN